MNIRHAIKLRTASQAGFFALFVLLLLRTGHIDEVMENGPGFPVQLFFQIDPLVAIENALASHALYRGLIWSLVVLVPTMFLGRFFCGWICPLGTINHFMGSWRSLAKRGAQRLASNRYKPWQKTKYLILLAGLTAAAFGTGLIGWFDPFSLLVRSLGLSILPAVNYAADAALGRLEGIGALSDATAAARSVLSGVVLNFRQPHFQQGFLLGVLFLAILAANLRVTRFWCRALCPLGALLGIASRWSIFGLTRNPTACNNCNTCLTHCQGGDDPVATQTWHKAECLMCGNCVGSCSQGALSFGFFPDAAAQTGPDLSRRAALTSLAAGGAAAPLLRSSTGFAVGRDERLLRPPGALEEHHFLDRCIRCGACMKACPTNALQPGMLHQGIEGLWTPVLVPQIGYCEPSCTLCSEVCPTGAIWRITRKEKGWADGVEAGSAPIRLGTAFFDRGRCLPWAMATECIVCEEWCPVSPKAVRLQTVEVLDAAGNKKTVRQPSIDPTQCVGCGACEYACVVADRPAVYVTSIGESRSSTNQLLLSPQTKKS